MCGICGFVNYKKQYNLSVIEAMAKVQSHRGPDDVGVYTHVSDYYELAFGHVRLSILDLSDQGHQPMSFLENTIVFNGEIYNYREIRDELLKQGHSFSSNCDTEVVLHAYKEWGAECVSRFIGMYAFAIYNQSEQSIFICRDRAGIKPLYYYYDDNNFIFGSELKVLHQYPGFKKQINQDAIALYMRLGYIPAPYSIFENTYKLPQGHYLHIDLKSHKQELKRYWNLHDYYSAPKLDISYEEAKDKIEEILKSSFNYRMVSDVPVGVFLSAGFDSSCVAALLQTTSSKKIKTFTIGFESGVDEAPRARIIANHLKTDHTEYYCSIQDGQKLIEQLPFYYDEPFADSSAIPTMLVSKLASQDVSVVLSADGGDEIFGGYNSYDTLVRRYHQIGEIPKRLYHPLASVLSFIAPFSMNQHTTWRLEYLRDILKGDLSDLQMALVNNSYRNFTPGYQGKMFLFESKPELPVLSEDIKDMDLLSKLMYIDYIQYMCDDVLVKVDRATMSVSIEGRDPFLDQRIIEFAARVPSEYKYDGITKKKILKDIVYKYIPKDIMDMPKTGFSLPLAEWLDNGLRKYVNHYLSQHEIEKTEVFDYKYVEFCKKQFKKDRNMNASTIWEILQFQMWYDRWMVN